jgi:hypothetical protein
MSRHTSLSLLALSLSGALTTSCVESKCSLSEWQDSTDCQLKDSPNSAIGNLTVSPLRWSLTPGVTTTLKFSATNGSSLEGKTVSIVQGTNTFPVFGQVDNNGELRARMSDVQLADGMTIYKLKPGKAALKFSDSALEGGRLYTSLKFQSTALSSDITSDILDKTDPTKLWPVDAVKVINHKFNDITKTQILSTHRDTKYTYVSAYELSSVTFSKITIPDNLFPTQENKLFDGIAVSSTEFSVVGKVDGTDAVIHRWSTTQSASSLLMIPRSGSISALSVIEPNSQYIGIVSGLPTIILPNEPMNMQLKPVTTSSADGSYPLLVGDLTGDGLGDIISWNANGQPVMLRQYKPQNSTTATFEPDGVWTKGLTTLSMESGRFPVALADLDGDGLADLVNATKDGIQIYYNNGDGTFYKETATIGPLQNAKSVQALAVAVPTADGSGVRGLVWVATESGKPTLNVLKY